MSSTLLLRSLLTRQTTGSAQLFSSKLCFFTSHKLMNTKSTLASRVLGSSFTSRTLTLGSAQPSTSSSRTNILLLLPNFRRTFSSSNRSLLRYHPAGRNNRNGGERVMFAFLDRIPQNTVFWGIMGLNAGVFLMWFMAQQKWQQERDPSAIRFMAKNFLNAWGNLVEGRIWTPLTCCFSHKDVSHILMNAFTFYFLSRNVLQMLGSRRFILLYIGGGMVSSFTSMFYAMVINRAGYMSHGASGAIYSTMSFLACVAPTLTFQLYGIIPVPAWLVVTGLFGYDVYSTLSNKMGTTDTVGHIGGFLGGIAFFVLMRRGRIV